MKALSVARSWLSNIIGQRGGVKIFTGYGTDPWVNTRHRLDDLDGTGWQRGLVPDDAAMYLPIVAAIHNLYGNAFAQLRPHHRRLDMQTGRIETIRNSAASRLLVQPNGYESFSTMLSRIASDWLSGEALIWASENGRTEPDEIHLVPRGSWSVRVDPESRAVYYVISADESYVFDPDPEAISIDDVRQGRVMALRSKDVMHLRWTTPRHPLIGESAFAAAGMAAGVNVALNRAQLAFTENMRRVSAILSTDAPLTPAQTRQARQLFDEQARDWSQGGIPVLSSGIKLSSINLSAIDASVITALRYSNEDIARCAGVPPPLYGDLSHGTINSSDALIRHWLSVSLGGLIERLERELERLFRMDGRHDYIELSTEALLRSDMQSQADAYSKLVQGGVLTPDEVRLQMGHGPADGGSALMVQRQMTPITLNTELALAELAAKTSARAEPAPDDDGDEDDVAAETDEDVARRVTLMAIARSMERRR
jgi:HK97 family phage portal protein